MKQAHDKLYKAVAEAKVKSQPQAEAIEMWKQEQEIAVLGYHTWCDRCIKDINLSDKQLLNKLPSSSLFSPWIVKFGLYYISIYTKQQSCIVKLDFTALIHLSEACLYLGVLRTCKKL